MSYQVQILPVNNHSLRMLVKGIFVSLILANVFVVNVIGKTLLIETEDTKSDEKDTQDAVAQGKRGHISI